MRFEGQAVIVTGAGSGIGRATALRLAEEGAHVLAIDRQAPGLEAMRASIADETDRARVETLTCDVSETGAPAKIVATCLNRVGRIDVLVNNAGIGGGSAPFTENDDAAILEPVAINSTLL